MHNRSLIGRHNVKISLGSCPKKSSLFLALPEDCLKGLWDHVVGDLEVGVAELPIFLDEGFAVPISYIYIKGLAVFVTEGDIGFNYIIYSLNILTIGKGNGIWDTIIPSMVGHGHKVHQGIDFLGEHGAKGNIDTGFEVFVVALGEGLNPMLQATRHNHDAIMWKVNLFPLTIHLYLETCVLFWFTIGVECDTGKDVPGPTLFWIPWIVVSVGSYIHVRFGIVVTDTYAEGVVSQLGVWVCFLEEFLEVGGNGFERLGEGIGMCV